MAILGSPITRKEHFLAKAAGQDVETPEPITREEMYLDAIASGSGGGGGADNQFIVTCTPTALDYSGTMDKTVAEISAAWNDGKEIYFYLPGYAKFPVAAITDEANFFAYGIILGNPGKFIIMYTDSLGTSYSTTVYKLTLIGE